MCSPKTWACAACSFFDLLQEEAEQAGDDAESLFEATFALMTGELAVLIADLIDALGGEPQDQDA